MSQLPDGPKRTPEEREADLLVTAELRCKGKTYAEIRDAILARHPGMSLSIETIRQDCLAVEKLWEKEHLRPVRTLKAVALARLDAVLQAAWEGWEASKRDERKATRISSGSNAANRYAATKTIQHTATRDGDPRFLMVALKTIEQVSKLLGLDAPIKLQSELVDGDDALKARIHERFMEATKIRVVEELRQQGWKEPEKTVARER